MRAEKLAASTNPPYLSPFWYPPFTYSQGAGRYGGSFSSGCCWLLLVHGPAKRPASSRSASQHVHRNRFNGSAIRSWSGRRQPVSRFLSRVKARCASSGRRNVCLAANTPGWLKIFVHSAISGRPLAAPVVDQRGEGKGIGVFQRGTARVLRSSGVSHRERLLEIGRLQCR